MTLYSSELHQMEDIPLLSRCDLIQSAYPYLQYLPAKDSFSSQIWPKVTFCQSVNSSQCTQKGTFSFAGKFNNLHCRNIGFAVKQRNIQLCQANVAIFKGLDERKMCKANHKEESLRIRGGKQLHDTRQGSMVMREFHVRLTTLQRPLFQEI